MSETVNLTEAQRAIVEAKESKIVVVAAAAAGKTRCITERIRWLLNQGVPANEIVAITFTNAAAEEISERLDNPSGLFIGTIHSLANFYLKANGNDTSKILNEEKFDKLFEKVKQHPECVKHVTHLIVDEAQDSNPLQFEFLLDMINPDNYMLMGDHRQSIYRWNGAKPEYILNLMLDPSVKVYQLTENYRNGKNILDFARELINPLGNKYTDNSKAMREAKGAVLTTEYYGPGIASTIKRRVDKGQDNYSDWFIVTRTNAQSEKIINELIKAKVPYDTFKKANLDNKGLKQKMKENTVKVLTIHTAKGLEAKNVIVIGAHFKDVEERCLCYVAATRAKDLLVWTNSPNRKKPKVSTWGC